MVSTFAVVTPIRSRTNERNPLALALVAVVAPKTNRIFTQRGNIGIDVFDSNTLLRMPTIEAPDVYGLSPSPDGRWLFATNTFAGSTLDIFDLQSAKLVRHFKVPAQHRLNGLWLGRYFYLFGFDSERQGHIWRVSADDTEVDSGRPFQLPGPTTGSAPGFLKMVKGDERLFLYEPFGTHFTHRCLSCAPSASGVYEIDPTNGRVLNSIAPTLHFTDIAIAPDGEKLFGISVDSVNSENVRLVRVDGKSGHLEAVRELSPDDWHISLADIPEDLIPR